MVPLASRLVSRALNLAATAVDRAAAEEIVQDVFVAVWRNAGSFDPERGTVRDWLLKITRNRIANELRRRGQKLGIAPRRNRPGQRAPALPEVKQCEIFGWSYGERGCL